MKKLSILITLVLISLLTLSAVSAANTEEPLSDTQNMDVQTTDNIEPNIATENSANEKTVIKSENKKDNLKEDTEGSFSDLNTAIENNITNNNYEITLNKNYKYNDEQDTGLKEGITIDGNNIKGKQLKIKGNGEITIDGNYNARIFNVINGAELILENLNLIKGDADYGGAISADKSSSLTINNCNFEDNGAYYGGAIYTNGNTNIKESTFQYNNAQNGGAIYTNGTLTISKTKFSYNNYNEYEGMETVHASQYNDKTYGSSNIYGGAIYSDGNTSIKESTFQYNMAKIGFAIYSNGTLTLSTNIFADIQYDSIRPTYIKPLGLSANILSAPGYLTEIDSEKDLIMNNNIILIYDLPRYQMPNTVEAYINGKVTGKNNKVMTTQDFMFNMYFTTQEIVNNLTKSNLETNLTQVNNKLNTLLQINNKIIEENNKLLTQLKLSQIKAKTSAISLKLKTTKITKKSRRARFTATLKINGKVAKGKTVIFTFRGKVFTAKTNKKGIAKVIIKKKLLRKLLKNVKPGEKLICQAKYGSKAVKVLKVKK